MTTKDDMITVSVLEAARRLSIGKNLAYEKVAEGVIPSMRLGGRLLVPVLALECAMNGIELGQLRKPRDVLEQARQVVKGGSHDH